MIAICRNGWCRFSAFVLIPVGLTRPLLQQWRNAKMNQVRAILAATVCVALLGADPCPNDCPRPADPTGLNCDTCLRNCVGTVGNATIVSTKRTGVNQVVFGSCDSCNQKNKGTFTAGVGQQTTDTSWTVNLPFGIGSVTGGDVKQTINLSSTLNCVDCKNVRAPYYVYNVTGTVNVPYTLQSRTGFFDTYCWWPFSYVMVIGACPNGYSTTTTFNTLEGAVGPIEDLGCPGPKKAPCCDA